MSPAVVMSNGLLSRCNYKAFRLCARLHRWQNGTYYLLHFLLQENVRMRPHAR